MNVTGKHTLRTGLAIGSLATVVWLAVGSAAPRATAQSAWTGYPPLSTVRAEFGLVPLASGNLLAVGGLAASGIRGQRDAEVFASRAGRWSPVAPMPAGHRYRHQARLLASGEALVVGDEYEVGEPQANVFNEQTGTWRTTRQPPKVSRFEANLTVLADGRVLYTGGYGGGSDSDTFDSAEIYDPALDSWTLSGSMAQARMGHGAIRLTTGSHAGKVLVAGGMVRVGEVVLASTELFDPATGSWQPAAPLAEARSFFTLTPLPDGRVLAVGGQYASPFTGVMVGRRSAEIYDPVAGQWQMARPMTTLRARHTATLLPDGRVVAVGGFDTAVHALASCEVYDPSADRWSACPRLNTARRSHEAALVPGHRLLVAGGLGPASEVLSSTELLDVGNRAPTPTPDEPEPTAPRPTPPSPTPAPATPAATPSAGARACPQLVGRVPRAAIEAALANPDRVEGYRRRQDPSKPAGPFNPLRTWLTLQVYARPYQPIHNGLIFRGGCP